MTTTVTTERRAEERERRRLEIVEAALAEFSETGYEATTMAGVARRARLSKGLLYFYFKDKDDLLMAITLDGLEKLQSAFRRASKTRKTGLEKTIAIGRTYLGFAAKFPQHFEAMDRFDAKEVEPGKGEDFEQECVKASAGVHSVVIEAIEIGIRDGSIRNTIGNPAMVSVLLWSFLHGVQQVVRKKGAMLMEAYGFEHTDVESQAIEFCRQNLATVSG
jgi:AcrR family transcriptional regulator